MNSTLSTNANTSDAQKAPPNHAQPPASNAATARAVAIASTIEMKASAVPSKTT